MENAKISATVWNKPKVAFTFKTLDVNGKYKRRCCLEYYFYLCNTRENWKNAKAGVTERNKPTYNLYLSKHRVYTRGRVDPCLGDSDTKGLANSAWNLGRLVPSNVILTFETPGRTGKTRKPVLQCEINRRTTFTSRNTGCIPAELEGRSASWRFGRKGVGELRGHHERFAWNLRGPISAIGNRVLGGIAGPDG